ncbi:tRNA (adenosine(37)-N6)-threonylcarbamoyltransferase complex dimerization subunit type 1 TsaB [Lysobacter korlensis]|uniref:tRNA threonylcarbamoyladenosine biosynthesis protein TsaB n=1 Tax=Lysobacter korlensis TaxID=553636 RepID=A0ABV6RY23_9GAMM
MLLAIDTSAGTSVAVVDRDRGVLSEHSVEDTRRHAEVIGDLIERALRDAGISARKLSGVAVGMGPGPFTGLRVGIAAARAFAFGAGKPVVPVVSHDAVAFGRVTPVTVVTDARRREVYWSSYDSPDAAGLPRRDRGPSLAAPDEVPADRERVDARWVSAASVGLLAEALYAAGRPFAPDEPLYLRSPDVTMSTTNASGRRVT